MLLLFLPVALLAHFAGIGEIFIFAASALAIIPLAKILGEATEVVAKKTGPRTRGLLIIALTAASMISALVSLDGESNWLEGAMLLAVYCILGLAFFFLPLKL